MPQYFEHKELSGKPFFTCDRLSASIAVATCASMWHQANRVHDPARVLCRLCPLGAIHAGAKDANLSPLKGSRVCSRCRRLTDRLIHGDLCVSCKNREYEWKKGRNARGHPLIKTAPLEQRRLRYLEGNETRELRRNLSRDTEELVVSVIRKAANKVRFLPAPTGIISLAELHAPPKDNKKEGVEDDAVPVAPIPPLKPHQSRPPESTLEADSWQIEDHVCQVCYGRVVASQNTDHPVRIYRCVECGLTATGSSPAVICSCGLTHDDGTDKRIRCMRNPNQRPDRMEAVLPVQMLAGQAN